MPIWKKFAEELAKNEQALRNGRDLPDKKVAMGDQIQLGDFVYTPIVMTGKLSDFPRVGITTSVASLLQLPTTGMTQQSLPFHQIVEGGSTPNSPMQRALQQFSIMGFFVPGVGPKGLFVNPDRAVQEAQPIEEPFKGRDRQPARQNDLPDTPKNLPNGIWYHIPTGTEFFIDDNRYHSGATQGPAAANAVADAPILALGNNLNRVLAVSADTDIWYEENPPPAAPRNREMYYAYVRSLRSYLKKMAIQLIERDHWLLLWHGFLYTNSRAFDFDSVFRNSLHLPDLRKINWPDSTTITELDANNASIEVDRFVWGELKTATKHRAAGRGSGEARYAGFYKLFEAIGQELRDTYPQLFVRRAPAMAEDIELTGDLLHALVEGRLDESLTYNQMLNATAMYWQTRLKTVRNVRTKPPGLVMLKDGTVDLSFDFVSVPSTEGRPHVGYVKFVPERGQPRLIDRLKDFLGRIGQQVKKFIGKKVPPRALKGSDLRKMLCEVSCDCKDFKYRMSYANVKQGVTTQAGRTDNGRAPVKTNPAGRPGFCKHILATLRYLTDDAEIQISKELSLQQQEALKKDRAQFYKEAQVSYEQMKAPAAKGAEEIEPEEEPISPEFAKLPAPPKPELAPTPPVPPVAPAPPGPNYQSTQA